MGIIRNGANGGFSGKAGSVIGSSWNSLSYIKGLYKKSTKPATLKQLDQRLRFATAVRYLAPIKDVLNLGYKGQTANRATGYNMGVQYALTNAITGVYPDYEIDHSKIQVSKGTLLKPTGVSLASSAAAQLEVSWSAQINDLNAFADDQLFIVLYNKDQAFFTIKTDLGARGDAMAVFAVPADFSTQVVEVYLFYINRDNTRRSLSTYSGPLVIA